MLSYNEINDTNDEVDSDIDRNDVGPEQENIIEDAERDELIHATEVHTISSLVHQSETMREGIMNILSDEFQ